MRKKIIALFLFAGIFLASSVSCEAWYPKNEKKEYKEVMEKVKEIETYSHFLSLENKFVKQPTDKYYEARWNYLKEIALVNPRVATPGKAAKPFMDFCKKVIVSNENIDKFNIAIIALGNELITDRVPFNIPMDGIVAHRDIEYTTSDNYNMKLDLFIPQNNTKAIPCIIFIHGGGWKVHKRAWMEGHARYLASKGYAAATIDYRMLNRVTPVECVHDAKAAVRWIRKNANKYQIDPNKIGACGGSAGAHLSVTLATTADNKELEGMGGNNDTSSKIQAAVGFATPTLTGNNATWPLKTDEKPDWYYKVSPYANVSGDAAPMLFIHGSNDKTVDINEAREMCKKCNGLGVYPELSVLEGAGHVFYMNQEYADRAYRFFYKIFEPK